MQDDLAAAAELKSYTFIEVTHTSVLYQDTIGRARRGGKSYACAACCSVLVHSGRASGHCGQGRSGNALPLRGRCAASAGGTLEGTPAESLRADTSRARRASAGSWLLATPRAAEAEGAGGRRRAAATAAASRGRPGLKRLRGATGKVYGLGLEG